MFQFSYFLRTLKEGGTGGGWMDGWMDGWMEGGRGGEGGRDDCYKYSNIGMFHSNPMAPRYLNNNQVTYNVIT